MSDVLEEVVTKLEVKCPVHNKNMVGKRVEVKTGYTSYVRKVMYIGECKEEGCNKWFEYLPFPKVVLWP